MKIKTLALAKINLGLHITGVTASGYHKLESLVTFAKINDVIEVYPSNKLELSVIGPYADFVPKNSSNIVIKAAKLLSPNGKAFIKLTKNLPVEAGLGGGSADAAATLRALSKLWKIPLPDCSITLGSDVPVCLYNKPSIIKGTGDKIYPVVMPKNLQIILIKPEIGLSTKKVFNNLRNKNNEKMPDFLGTNSLDFFSKQLNSLRNDLLNTSINFAPIIKDLINFLDMQNGIIHSQMSGSGTACFGLFNNANTAKIAYKNAINTFPEMWCKMTESIN